jgi:hypothetical protein
MTEEQRVKLEELISEYGHREGDHYGTIAEVEKARDRITDHLTLIQWSTATYNLRRGGEVEMKLSVFMDVDNKDEDGVGVDLPKCLVENPIAKMSKVGKNLDDDEEIIEELGTLAEEERKGIQKKP